VGEPIGSPSVRILEADRSQDKPVFSEISSIRIWARLVVNLWKEVKIMDFAIRQRFVDSKQY
jgi:hypothetical protein